MSPCDDMIQWYIATKETTHGTYLNDARCDIDTEYRLQEGDKLRLGSFELVYHREDVQDLVPELPLTASAPVVSQAAPSSRPPYSYSSGVLVEEEAGCIRIKGQLLRTTHFFRRLFARIMDEGLV